MSYLLTLDQVLKKLRDLGVIIIEEHLAYSLLSDFTFHRGACCFQRCCIQAGNAPGRHFINLAHHLTIFSVLRWVLVGCQWRIQNAHVFFF